VGYHDETDPELSHHVTTFDWFYLGQLKRLIKYFQQHGVKQAVMLGAITKTRLFTNVRPDLKVISLMATMRHTHDDAILRAFARALEEEGIRIEPSTLLLPELLAPAGVWTRRPPSKAELEDIRLGWKIAKAIGAMDIGQCVLVGGGSVLAVEAIDGTDATIRRGGALGKGEAVVVKVCKPTQDTRFDIPAVGSATIDTMHASHATALAVEAGKAVVFDRQAMIEKANHNGISIIAINELDLKQEP
jgi:hypothetical protein